MRAKHTGTLTLDELVARAENQQGVSPEVLDFGLAKAMEPTGAMSHTITTPAMTQAGMILGTPPYTV